MRSGRIRNRDPRAPVPSARSRPWPGNGEGATRWRVDQALQRWAGRTRTLLRRPGTSPGSAILAAARMSGRQVAGRIPRRIGGGGGNSAPAAGEDREGVDLGGRTSIRRQRSIRTPGTDRPNLGTTFLPHGPRHQPRPLVRCPGNQHAQPEGPRPFKGLTWTYGEMLQRIDAVSADLQDGGVRHGDRVAFLGLNQPAFFETMFATARLGAIFVPLNFRLTGPELAYIINDAGIHTLVADEPHEPVVESVPSGIAGARVTRSADVAGAWVRLRPCTSATVGRRVDRSPTRWR